MNTDRETKSISIGGHEVIMKTYASAREAQAIKGAVYKGAKLEMTGESPKISDFNFAATDEVEKEMIRQLVIAIDAEDAAGDNLVNKVLDWRVEWYQELVTELDNLTGKKK